MHINNNNDNNNNKNELYTSLFMPWTQSDLVIIRITIHKMYIALSKFSKNTCSRLQSVSNTITVWYSV